MTNKAKLGGLAVMLITLAGCEAYDLGVLSTLEPTNDPGVFRYTTSADAIYPVDDPEAEEARVRQLRKRMADNNVCGGSYEITDRTAIRNIDGLLGDGYEVYYTVRCT